MDDLVSSPSEIIVDLNIFIFLQHCLKSKQTQLYYLSVEHKSLFHTAHSLWNKTFYFTASILIRHAVLHFIRLNVSS